MPSENNKNRKRTQKRAPQKGPKGPVPERKVISDETYFRSLLDKVREQAMGPVLIIAFGNDDKGFKSITSATTSHEHFALIKAAEVFATINTDEFIFPSDGNQG